MGMSWELLAAPVLAPFEIEIQYEDLAGNKHSGRYNIDVAPFDGLHRLGKPPQEEIADALKAMAKSMESWAHNRLQVETMSLTERREHDAKVRKSMEERRAKRGDPLTKDNSEV